MAWLNYRKEKFSGKRKSKLMLRLEDPKKVFEKFGESAYKLELLGDYKVLATFNGRDLSSYFEYEEYLVLRTKPYDPRGTNVGADMQAKQATQSIERKNAVTLLFLA